MFYFHLITLQLSEKDTNSVRKWQKVYHTTHFYGLCLRCTQTSIIQIHKLLSDIHWTADRLWTFSRGAVFENANVWVRCCRLSLEFLYSQPQVRCCVDNVSNMWQMHKVFLEKTTNKTNTSGWKSGAMHLQDTEKDVKKAFDDKGRAGCAVNTNTWSLQLN